MKKFLLIFLLIFLTIILLAGAWGYKSIYGKNVSVAQGSTLLYIPSNSNFEDVIAKLKDIDILDNESSFEWVAKLKKYPEKIKAGRYTIKHGWNNNYLVNMLRSGKQEAIKVTFNNARTKEDLAGKIAPYLEFDSLTMLNQLNNEAYWAAKKVKPELVTSYFIPNTYNVYWNTSAEKFCDRMINEYEKFWTEERKRKADKLKLTEGEVMTLASIVQAETRKRDEAPKVAGVYLNRIRKGIPLQADPTLIFALGDFSIKRVLNVHKEIESPYNTYKYKGIPPGPIGVPEIYAIDAVLEDLRHNYIYFCAKEDFSGYHNFAKTYNEHIKNANRYQRALNKRKIFK